VTIYRDKWGNAVTKDRWISLVVDTDSRVSTACVVTADREEIEVTTTWIGIRRVDEVTGIESGSLYSTLIHGGSHDGTCVEHPTFLVALWYHDAAVAALRAGRPLPDVYG
jgi:hypothetical protein